jgi:aldehyde:ferredoxin oxidoreductase
MRTPAQIRKRADEIHEEGHMSPTEWRTHRALAEFFERMDKQTEALETLARGVWKVAEVLMETELHVVVRDE